MKTLHEVWAEFTAELASLFARFHSHPVVQAAVAAQAPVPPLVAPAPTVVPGTTIPSNPVLDAYLHGSDGGNATAAQIAEYAANAAGVPDPYGDHNGSVFPFGGPNDGGGFLWFGQGTKAMTLQGIVAGKMVSLSMADLGGAASLTVKTPSGADVPEAAFSGTDYRDWTAAESGDYVATVVSESPRGSLRLTRHG